MGLGEEVETAGWGSKMKKEKKSWRKGKRDV